MGRWTDDSVTDRGSQRERERESETDRHSNRLTDTGLTDRETKSQ
jgi:hypothetical protein